MRIISASDAKQGLAGVLEAANKEPVVIRRHSRDVAVVMSMQEYERLTRLNVAEFQRFCDAIGARAAVAGLTEAGLARMLARDE
jgi:prevent-host-death family protein